MPSIWNCAISSHSSRATARHSPAPIPHRRFSARVISTRPLGRDIFLRSLLAPAIFRAGHFDSAAVFRGEGDRSSRGIPESRSALQDSVPGGLHEIGNIGEHDEGRPKQHLRLLATHGSSLQRRPGSRSGPWQPLGKSSHGCSAERLAQGNRRKRATASKHPRHRAVFTP